MYERIKRYRKSLGLNKGKFSKYLGYSDPFYSNVLSGKQNLQLATVKKLAREMKISVFELYKEVRLRGCYDVLEYIDGCYEVVKVITRKEANEIVKELGYNTVNQYMLSECTNKYLGRYELVEHEILL